MFFLSFKQASANIFNVYFCASDRDDYDDADFNSYVENFDKIFWEVNTGRLSDFIPKITFLAALPIFQSKVCTQKNYSFSMPHLVTPVLNCPLELCQDRPPLRRRQADRAPQQDRPGTQAAAAAAAAEAAASRQHQRWQPQYHHAPCDDEEVRLRVQLREQQEERGG